MSKIFFFLLFAIDSSYVQLYFLVDFKALVAISRIWGINFSNLRKAYLERTPRIERDLFLIARRVVYCSKKIWFELLNVYLKLQN